MNKTVYIDSVRGMVKCPVDCTAECPLKNINLGNPRNVLSDICIKMGLDVSGDVVTCTGTHLISIPPTLFSPIYPLSKISR